MFFACKCLTLILNIVLKVSILECSNRAKALLLCEIFEAEAVAFQVFLNVYIDQVVSDPVLLFAALYSCKSCILTLME